MLLMLDPKKKIAQMNNSHRNLEYNVSGETSSIIWLGQQQGSLGSECVATGPFLKCFSFS
jgi:hypothetical protein